MSDYIVNQQHMPVSKAGVRHLACSMAAEWVDYNIRVNSIPPSIMATGCRTMLVQMAKSMAKQEGLDTCSACTNYAKADVCGILKGADWSFIAAKSSS